MKKLLLLLPLFLSLSFSHDGKHISQEQNSTKNSNENPAILYMKKACNSCHGIYGGGIGASPRLRGIRKEVLLKRLKALQAGNPRTPFGGIMISFAQSLDENQTIAMAKYLSTLKEDKKAERYEEEPSDDNF